MRYTEGTIYILQFKYNKELDSDWRDANTDYYFVRTKEYDENHAGWQKYGIHCWENEKSAIICLTDICNKYASPEYNFRMAKVYLKKEIIGSIKITNS